MTLVELPDATGGWRTVELREPRQWKDHPQPYESRVAFAAAHVVANPLGNNVPGAPADVDWESTLAFRRSLFRYGLGVAEAMDTAQRNMGLDWPAIQELIARSAAQAKDLGARIASGAGTDHKDDLRTIDDVAAAFAEQVSFVEGTGSQVIVMASRHLARMARDADDYLRVYEAILGQVREPVILHWLGEAFDPQLRGYWGSTDVAAATATFVDLVAAHADKVDGVKVSLLSADHEVGLRASLPPGVRLYTGDDFNYPELIRGDGRHHSDALLGAFAAIAPAAAAALAALDDGRCRDLRRRACADAATVPAHLRGAYLLLQDRHRVHVVADRPAAWLHHGRWPPVGAQRRPPGAHLRARQRGAAVARRRLRGASHAQPARHRRGGAMTTHAVETLDVPSGLPARVPTPQPGDPRLARLSLNQRTTARWTLREAIDGAVAAGLSSIGVWREPVADVGLATAKTWLADAGLRVSSVCRGGFFTSTEPSARTAAHESNRAAIDEAAELGAATLVLVPGGLPDGDRDISGARARVADAIADLVPYATQLGVRLGIEAMHPIYAADRGVVSTLAQALDIAEQFPAEVVGVVVDTFHVWWEPGVERQIARAAGRITSYQVCDWITPLPADALLSRGMMGDGHIDFGTLTRAVAAAGYSGDVEVEIFNADVWAAPGADVVATLARRYIELVQPHLGPTANPTGGTRTS